MRIKLTIQYLGANYCGWQSQKNGVAIQDVVEKALSEYFGGKKIRLFAAGRTDVGVNARAMAAHFDVEADKFNAHKLCLGVNLSLPQDVAVVSAEKVADNFDARFDAKEKVYCYRFYVSAVRNPLLDDVRTQIYKMPDVAAMQSAAKLFVGTHDFSAFKKDGGKQTNPVRSITSLEVTTEGNFIDVTVRGMSFLYNMVRIISGTLLAVGYGKITQEDILQMLQSGKRKNGIKTLSPKGLTLEQIYY